MPVAEDRADTILSCGSVQRRGCGIGEVGERRKIPRGLAEESDHYVP